MSAFEGEPILPESLGMAAAGPTPGQPAAPAPAAAATSNSGAQPAEVQPATPADAPQAAREVDAQMAVSQPDAPAPAVQQPDQLAAREEAVSAADAAAPAPLANDDAALRSDAAAAHAVAATEQPAEAPVGDTALPEAQQMDVDPPQLAPHGEAVAGAEHSLPVQQQQELAGRALSGSPVGQAAFADLKGTLLPQGTANGIAELAKEPLHDSAAAEAPSKQLHIS